MLTSSQKSHMSRARHTSHVVGSQSRRVAVLCGVLFLSGTGALIFETLWLRLSGLAFGNSVWAAALILSSFMAGLALGNALAASSRIRRWRPLHFYAVLELLVAFFGFTIVFGLPVLGDLMRPVWQMLWNYQPTLLGLRFAVSFLILLVPTTAMGLTLPVIIEDPLLQETEFGRAIGFLYGSNTLGAMVGAVLGEAYLIGAFGLYGTSLAAGAAVCIAAAIALSVARFGAARYADLKSPDPAAHSKFPLSFNASYRPPWRLLFVSFGTGLIFLALEVIWFRFLRLYVASSPTAFAIMLAVVLAGIGAGGLVGGAVFRSLRRSNQMFAILLLAAAIFSLLSYLLFPGGLIRAPTGVFDLRWWQIAVLCVALMFPVALLSGILFPLIGAGVQASVGDRMNSTGLATLLNTTGAAIGPLVASFVLLPTLGYQTSLICCAVGYALLSLLVTERAAWSFRRPMGIVAVAALWAILILGLVFFPYGRAGAHFAHASRPYEVNDQGQVLARVVKRIEGTSDTWQLLQRDLFGEPYYYRLLSDAFSMSATNPRNQRYMRLFAYVPLAFHPAAKNVLLLCYGCGVTADAFTRKSTVERIDAVDISKEVFALADSYSNYSNPLHDPRVHAVVQDGRFFLQASPQQYDVISGEPPPPKVAGAVNLYTQEFFSLMRSRLKENGIATFWLPINQLKVDETKAILRAFHNAFPNTLVWGGADQDWIMMGINGPGRKVSEDELRQLWNDPTTGADLRTIGIEVPQQLGALFLMDGDEIDRITQNVGPLTDVYPKRLTDGPWDDQANHRFALNYLTAPAAVQRFVHSAVINQIWPETLNPAAAQLESFFIVRQSRYLSETVGSNKLAELDLYLRHSRLRIPVLEVLGSDALRVSIAERAAKSSATPPLEVMPDLIAGALAQRNINRGIQLLESEKDRGPFGADDTFLLTYLYCLNGSVEKAETLIAANPAGIKKDSFVEWLWGKLETDFGFRPPGN
jgi:spermidine synthase